MERERTIARDDLEPRAGRPAPPDTPGYGAEPGCARRSPTVDQSLGDVARDVMDHGTMILRDGIKLAKLEGSRYSEHLLREVAPRGVVAALGAVAVLCGLIALFLGIASALDSVAWAFAIYCALFAAAALVGAGLVARRSPAALQRSRYPTGGSTSLATLEAPRKT
jgi:Putative Actinobacterial Holin-X, holin superfamily III